jgi:hypothetical protein
VSLYSFGFGAVRISLNNLANAFNAKKGLKPPQMNESIYLTRVLYSTLLQNKNKSPQMNPIFVISLNDLSYSSCMSGESRAAEVSQLIS